MEIKQSSKRNVINNLSSFEEVKFSAIFLLRHFFKNSHRLKKIDQKYREELALKLKLRNPVKRIVPVERVSNISPQEFKKRFVDKRLPVIFENQCKEWPCFTKWNLDYLESNYAKEEFNLVCSKGFTNPDERPENADLNTELAEITKISELIKSIKTDGKKYMRFCPIMEEHVELINDLDNDWLKKMRVTFLGHSYQSFIGAKNKKTPIHCGMTAFFFILPFGQKKWTLFNTGDKALLAPAVTRFGYNYSDVDINNPDLEKYPGVDNLDRYECTLKEGDILYVPAWMWHEVENLTHTWGVSYRFAHLSQTWRQSFTFTFKRYFLTSPSIFSIIYYSFFRSDVAKRKKNLLTPKIFRR